QGRYLRALVPPRRAIYAANHGHVPIRSRTVIPPVRSAIQGAHAETANYRPTGGEWQGLPAPRGAAARFRSGPSSGLGTTGNAGLAALAPTGAGRPVAARRGAAVPDLHV